MSSKSFESGSGSAIAGIVISLVSFLRVLSDQAVIVTPTLSSPVTALASSLVGCSEYKAILGASALGSNSGRYV